LRRPHDDRPARGVKARRALRRRTMVAFHKEFRVSPTLAGESVFRNRIPETLKPGCLCNGSFIKGVGYKALPAIAALQEVATELGPGYGRWPQRTTPESSS
jgi:hypothetical protein